MFVSHCQTVAVKRIFLLAFFAVVMYGYYVYARTGTIYTIADESLPEWIYSSLEEIRFPLAYSISVERDFDQFLRLLRVIYRPFNLYCVHLSAGSTDRMQEQLRNLTARYKNVIVPERTVDVASGSFSVLESELLCMAALFNDSTVRWKYLINLNGQEWPLKVNLEIVRILAALKGANLVEKVIPNSDRFPKGLDSAPHNITLWKGAVHVIVVRDFVRFALFDQRALDLLEYLRKTAVPEESYFSTLNHEHSLKVPGGYSGDLLRDVVKYPFINRHKIWETEGECHGRFVHSICIFSMEDLPSLIALDNKNLFAHKFIKCINDNVLDHMERWIYNRSRTVYSNQRVNPLMNLTYYSQLTVVKNHY